MRVIKYKHWQLLLHNSISDQEGKALFDAIDEESYTVVELLKENQRSKVTRIALEGRDLVHKIPTEKNTRKWIRFITLFIVPEAFRNIMGMDKLWARGIKTTEPLMAAQKRIHGMVTDSWLVYKYLDGSPCLDQPQYYPQVIEALQAMHEKKLLHGDPQIRNFIAFDGEIYIIDSDPKPVGITGFDRAYEWAYLRKSAPGIENLFGEIYDWWLYKVAFWYDIYERKLKEQKRAFLRLLRFR